MRCNECDKQNGHEIWCSLTKETVAKPLASGKWIAVSEQGAEKRFKLAPQASEEFALDYAQQHITFIAGDTLAGVRRA